MAAGNHSMEFLLSQIMVVLRQTIDGYGFSPNEEELINYLKSENPGRREEFCIIPTVENICEIDPWKLKAEFREKSIIPSSDREWWFICPQTQKPRVKRQTPCGSSWKRTGHGKDIKAKADGKTIGFRAILTFPDNGRSKGGKSRWLIYEYRLPEDLDRKYVLCHLTCKQDEKADDSTSRSEYGAADLAKAEDFLLNQPADNKGSIPEDLIQEMMYSLMEPPQHQNQVFSLRDLLKLLQRGQQSLNNSFPSPMDRPQNIESSSAKVFSLNNSLTDISIELESSQGTAKEDESPDAMKLRARNIESCMFLDEIAARAKNGQIFITENGRSLIESLFGGASLEEIAQITQRMLKSSDVSSVKPLVFPEKPKSSMSEVEKVKKLEIPRRYAKLEECTTSDEYAAKGPECQEHNLADNSPKRRRLDIPEKSQIQ